MAKVEKTLDALSHCRLRPGMYAGDTTYSTQLLSEIFANTVDEWQIGNGKRVDVTIDKDVYTVTDEAQGFLINSVRPEDGKTVFEAAVSVMNTSGKYDDDGGYNGSVLGLNGMGTKITNYLSHWFIAATHQKGKYEKLWFKEGKLVEREVGDWEDNSSGTSISWQPSEEFFTNTSVEIGKIKNLFETISCLCKGLQINFTQDGKTITYLSDNGVDDLINKQVKNKELINNRLYINDSFGNSKLDLVLTYTKDYSSTIIPYVNTGLTDAGNHISQLKTTITREMNKFFRDNGWLKDKEENLSGDDIQEGLFMIFNYTTKGVGYDAQTKSRISKIDTTDEMGMFTEAFIHWMSLNSKDVKSIADKAIRARKAREAARKARDKARGEKPTSLKAKMQLSSKFIPCSGKDPAHRSLHLVEGTSAGSSAVEARNPKVDSIYMLRGKTISPLKTSEEDLLANQEMSDVIRILGAGYKDSFDIDKLQYDKVVITSDQDSDGMAIELLLITFFYTYMRPLVEQGHLYRAVTPLYIMRQKGQEYYAYTDKELEDWKAQHSGAFDLVRAKGLGELNAADLHNVCFKDERYKRITVKDANDTMALLEILEGKKVPPRKQFIFDNAKELGFHMD